MAHRDHAARLANLETGRASSAETLLERPPVNRAQVAIAVFVKTPGLSPIKTRLAAEVGVRAAAEFYELAIAAVEATVTRLKREAGISPYWAVAEEAGHADRRWRHFSCIGQGPGDLGERLGHVFHELQGQHETVIALGADSPQVTASLLQRACRRLQDELPLAAHVLGRCHDGGFYLAGTSRRLPPEVWNNVPYSTPDAADRLAAILTSYGVIAELPTLTDVDRAEDLMVLRDELASLAKLSSSQRTVFEWTSQYAV